MTNSADKTVADFVEQMGLILQTEGMPRIAGHIMGLMIMQEGPFSLSELAERLKVSRASISTNTRLLEDLEVIDRFVKPGDRQVYFRLSPQPYARMLRGIVRRKRRARDVVESTQDALPEGMTDAHARLQELNDFFEVLIDTFGELIDTWDADHNRTAKQTRNGDRPSA